MRLLHTGIDGAIEIAISEPIITETIRVPREKFDWPPHDLLAARQRLQKINQESRRESFRREQHCQRDDTRI